MGKPFIVGLHCWMRTHRVLGFSLVLVCWAVFALLAARMRAAQDRGMRFLVVDASSMSEPLLSKHGFLRLEHTSYCRWSPPGQAE